MQSWAESNTHHSAAGKSGASHVTPPWASVSKAEGGSEGDTNGLSRFK